MNYGFRIEHQVKRSIKEGQDQNRLSAFEIIPVFISMTKKESKKYHWLNSQVMETNNEERWIMMRSSHLKMLPSKVEVAKKAITAWREKKLKGLIFVGSIAQAEALDADYVYHSKMKKADKDRVLEDYANDPEGILVSVSALNEGVSLGDDLDVALITSITSQIRVTIQRLGRVLRGKKESTLYLIGAKGTIDEKWISNTLKELNQ